MFKNKFRKYFSSYDKNVLRKLCYNIFLCTTFKLTYIKLCSEFFTSFLYTTVKARRFCHYTMHFNSFLHENAPTSAYLSKITLSVYYIHLFILFNTIQHEFTFYFYTLTASGSAYYINNGKGDLL